MFQNKGKKKKSTLEAVSHYRIDNYINSKEGITYPLK